MIDRTPEQQVLMDFMSELSEDYYCAGWLDGLEYALWDVLQGNPKAFAAGDLKAEEIQKLQRLSDACKGWFYWNNDYEEGTNWEIGESFIPMEEWWAKFKAWKQKRMKRREREEEPW